MCSEELIVCIVPFAAGLPGLGATQQSELPTENVAVSKVAFRVDVSAAKWVVTSVSGVVEAEVPGSAARFDVMDGAVRVLGERIRRH